MAQASKGGQAPVAKGGWSSGGAGQEVKTSQRLPTRNSKGPIGHTPMKSAYLPRAPMRGARQNANTNPLYNPLAPLSGPSLKQAAGNIANVQVQGPINDARAQLNQNNKASATEQKTDFGYYMQLAQAAKDAVSSQQSQGAQLQSQLQGIGAGTEAQLGQLGQQAGSGALARMNALGLDGGQTQLLAADTAHQQGNSALQSQLGQTTGALQTANYVGEGNAIRGATGLQGQEQIGNLARATKLANQPLNQKIADLQASRGSLTATALGQLRTQERNYQIAQEGLQATATTAAQKLGLQAAQDKAANALKAAGIQVTQANNNARNQLTAQGQRITAQHDRQQIAAILSGQKITGANDLANQTLRQQQLAEKTGNDQATQAWRQAGLIAKGGGKSQLSLPAQNTIYKQLDEVLAAIPRLKQGGIKDKKGNVVTPNPNAAQIKGLLGTGYNATLIEAAYELQGWGALLPQTADAMKRMGLNLQAGTFRNAPLKVRTRPVGSPIYKAIGNLF